MNSFKRKIGRQELPLMAISDYDISQYPFSFSDDLNRLQFDYRLWLAVQRTVIAKYPDAHFVKTDLRATISFDNIQLDPALSQLAINNQVANYIQNNQDNPQPSRPAAVNGYFHAILPLLTFIEDDNNSHSVSGQFKLLFLLVAVKEIKQRCCNSQAPDVQISYDNQQLCVGGLTLKKLLLPSEQQQHNDVLSLLAEHVAQRQATSLNEMLDEKFICGENCRVVTYPYGFSNEEIRLIELEKNQMVLIVGGSLEKPTQATLISNQNGQKIIVSRDSDYMQDIFNEIINHRPLNHSQLTNNPSNHSKLSDNPSNHSRLSDNLSNHSPLHRRSSVGEDINILAYQNSDLLQKISKTFNYTDYSAGLIAKLMEIRDKDQLTLAEYRRMVGEVYSCLLCLRAAYDLHDAGGRKVRVRRCTDLSQQYIQNALQQSTPLPYNFSVDRIIEPNDINFNNIKNQALLKSSAEVDYNLYMPKRNPWGKFRHWASKHKLLLTYGVVSLVVIALALLIIFQPYAFLPVLLTAIKACVTYEATWKLATAGTALVWGAFSACWLGIWAVAKLIGNYCCCCGDYAIDDDTSAQINHISHHHDSLSITNSLRSQDEELFNDHSKLLDHQSGKQKNYLAQNDDYKTFNEFNKNKMERDNSHSRLSLNNHNSASVVSMMLVPSLSASQHQQNRDNDSLQQSHPLQRHQSHENKQIKLPTERQQYGNNDATMLIESDDDVSDQSRNTIE